MARVSAGHDHHGWTCFASHQGVEKAPKDLQLCQGQRAWGQGLGRLFRNRPVALQGQMKAGLSELVERLRISDGLAIPTPYPESLPDGAPSDHFGHVQGLDALSHPRAPVDAIAAAMA